jgi:6-phosphogluconolactonase
MFAPALLLALCLPHSEPKAAPFFIGTYTSPNGSQGIYEARLDLESGSLSSPVLVANTNNPSYLAVSPNGRNLYAVDESQEGSVSAYAIKEEKLLFINRQPVEGSSPCYLSVDPAGKNVLVASYSGGVVSCFPIAAGGALQPVTGMQIESGSGPDRSRQESPHMHWVQADTSNRFIYTCDLGTDKVQAFPFDSLTGWISPSLQPDLKVPSGSGPRHGAWGARGKFLYIANEMGSSVSVLKVDQSSGRLSLIQTLPSLETDAAVSHNTAAEIECHPTGKWLYVSNRGDDSVAVFRLLPSGDLKRIQVKHLGVRVPRGFAIDPTGKWLIAAGQESNNLEALPIDSDGRLGEATGRIMLSKPTCVAFCR